MLDQAEVEVGEIAVLATIEGIEQFDLVPQRPRSYSER